MTLPSVRIVSLPLDTVVLSLTRSPCSQTQLDLVLSPSHQKSRTLSHSSSGTEACQLARPLRSAMLCYTRSSLVARPLRSHPAAHPCARAPPCGPSPPRPRCASASPGPGASCRSRANSAPVRGCQRSLPPLALLSCPVLSVRGRERERRTHARRRLAHADRAVDGRLGRLCDALCARRHRVLLADRLGLRVSRARSRSSAAGRERGRRERRRGSERAAGGGGGARRRERGSSSARALSK